MTDRPATSFIVLWLCLQHHDVEQSDCQQTLRCLYYHGQTAEQAASGLWRAGAHTDFDTLTLLFQRPGESGDHLQLSLGPFLAQETRILASDLLKF